MLIPPAGPIEAPETAVPDPLCADDAAVCGRGQGAVHGLGRLHGRLLRAQHRLPAAAPVPRPEAVTRRAPLVRVDPDQTLTSALIGRSLRGDDDLAGLLLLVAAGGSSITVC